MRVPNISLGNYSPGERQVLFHAERYVFCSKRELGVDFWLSTIFYRFLAYADKLVKELIFGFLFLF